MKDDEINNESARWGEEECAPCSSVNRTWAKIGFESGASRPHQELSEEIAKKYVSSSFGLREEAAVRIEAELDDIAAEARRAAIEQCASKCCSIDSSDISHETAESNTEAIRALLKEKP